LANKLGLVVNQNHIKVKRKWFGN